MLRGQHHERRPVKRVRPRRVDRDFLVTPVHREVHFRAVRLANPVRLHLLDLLRPVQLVQVI